MTRQGFVALLGALAGLSAVALGAFAAHGASTEQARAWLETGAHYQMMHAFAVFAALAFERWGATRARFSVWFFFFGMIFFGGSLYGLAFGAPRVAGAVAPIGGVSYMIGWAFLAWAAPQLGRARAAE